MQLNLLFKLQSIFNPLDCSVHFNYYPKEQWASCIIILIVLTYDFCAMQVLKRLHCCSCRFIFLLINKLNLFQNIVHLILKEKRFLFLKYNYDVLHTYSSLICKILLNCIQFHFIHPGTSLCDSKSCSVFGYRYNKLNFIYVTILLKFAKLFYF